jgi:hypothetical protein
MPDTLIYEVLRYFHLGRKATPEATIQGISAAKLAMAARSLGLLWVFVDNDYHLTREGHRVLEALDEARQAAG